MLHGESAGGPALGEYSSKLGGVGGVARLLQEYTSTFGGGAPLLAPFARGGFRPG